MKKTKSKTEEVTVHDIAFYVCDVCGREYTPPYNIAAGLGKDGFGAKGGSNPPSEWKCIYEDEYEEAQWHICPDHDVDELFDQLSELDG